MMLLVACPPWRRVLAASALAIVVVGCRRSQTADGVARDFVAHPPAVESVQVRLDDAATNRATVTVRYAADPRLPERLVVAGDTEPLELRAAESPTPRDGEPRVYQGTTRLDVDALRARQRALDRLAAVHGDLVCPLYRDREKIGGVPVPALDLGGLLAKQPVELKATWVSPTEVDTDASLLVTNKGVVTDTTRTFDPCAGTGAALGKWSFGYLMQQLAGANDAAKITEQWLDQFKNTTTVNGIAVPPRPLVTSAILQPWPRTASGALDLAKAPFRLLAIVNRIDLAENLGYGSGSAGELRFVFGGVKPGTRCIPLNLAVIFEYAVPRSGCVALREWARAWVDLAGHPLGSSAYNAALETLTEQVVRAGLAPGRPNGSSLAQLRTDEIAFRDPAEAGTAEWELREFRLDTTGFLVQHVVRRTPRPEVNHTQTLADWVNANESAVLADTYEVPDTYPTGVPFAGGHARMSTGTIWKGPTNTSITNAQARHLFSLNTCSGCHAGETSTNFTHISPFAPPGSPLLSGFLTGITVNDPVTAGVTHTFGDLERRRKVLAGFANRSCLFLLFHRPLLMAH